MDARGGGARTDDGSLTDGGRRSRLRAASNNGSRGNGDRRSHLRAAPDGRSGPPDAGPPAGKQPRVGAGQLQWNTWGWFGGQIGSSVWLLALGIVALAQGGTLGLVPVGLFAVAGLVGALLWWRRDLLAPFPALEILLGTITVLSAAGVATILEGGLLGSGPGVPPGRWIYLYLLIFPALMAQLWVADRARRGPHDDDRRDID